MKLSVCIAIKDHSVLDFGGRRTELFPRCLRSLAETAREVEGLEVVIVDGGSTDWHPSEWAEEVVGSSPLAWSIHDGDVPPGMFNRAGLINRAVELASADVVAIIQADMLVPPALIDRGLFWVGHGAVFIPHYEREDTPDGKMCHWGNGTGNVILRKAAFEAAGRWPNMTVHRGHDDSAFYSRVYFNNPVVRERIRGFRHLWHLIETQAPPDGKGNRDT